MIVSSSKMKILTDFVLLPDCFASFTNVPGHVSFKMEVSLKLFSGFRLNKSLAVIFEILIHKIQTYFLDLLLAWGRSHREASI